MRLLVGSSLTHRYLKQLTCDKRFIISRNDTQAMDDQRVVSDTLRFRIASKMDPARRLTTYFIDR
jgi:hypothetical protein